MAVVGAILPLVSQSSALALLLYRLAAADGHAAKELLRTAKAISNLALMVKEVGTIIKEDDRLPSAEAFETIEDVLEQSAAVFGEIDAMVSAREQELEKRRNGQQNGWSASMLTPHLVARLHYLKAHLDSLRATLSVMLQTLYTAQSIVWAEVRPYVSPRQCATAVANEKQQLETLIIDQQMTILLASKLFEQARPDARLLMENDSSQSLSRVDENKAKPADLVKYQDKFIASLDTQTSDEEHWLASVCGVAKSQLDRLLERWTSLRRFEEDLLEEKRQKQAKQRESQQPFVESDSEDDIDMIPKLAGSGDGLDLPIPQRSDTVQPLFAEPVSLPIPVPTPAPTPTPSQGNASLPPSPRTSISTLPVEAAAAVEAKEEDAELDLEIPWTLRTRRHYWKYIDGKVQESNTDMPTSEAFRHRHSWTEVQASWVSPEALKEAGHPYTRVRKETPDGRRTKSETWFCIDRPLTFDEVQRLVERTVELYRRTQPPSPPPTKPRTRRTSFDRRSTGYDRDRTPLPPQPKQPPPLERSTTAYHISQPPPLDRTMSMPGSNSAQAQAQPPAQAPPSYPPKNRPTNLPIPTPSTPLPQSAPYSPNLPPQKPPQSQSQSHPRPPYPSQTYPPPPGHSRPIVHPAPYQPPPPPPPPSSSARHLQPHAPQVYSQSPLRSSVEGARHEYYSSASGTSDSEGVMRSRKERERSRRRRGSSSGRRKKGHGKTGALVGVAGLTALLDGLVGI